MYKRKIPISWLHLLGPTSMTCILVFLGTKPIMEGQMRFTFIFLLSYTNKRLMMTDICTGCLGKIVFFQRIFIILPPLPRRHWAAIGCTEIGQPIGDSTLALC